MNSDTTMQMDASVRGYVESKTPFHKMFDEYTWFEVRFCVYLDHVRVKVSRVTEVGAKSKNPATRWLCQEFGLAFGFDWEKVIRCALTGVEDSQVLDLALQLGVHAERLFQTMQSSFVGITNDMTQEQRAKAWLKLHESVGEKVHLRRWHNGEHGWFVVNSDTYNRLWP